MVTRCSSLKKEKFSYFLFNLWNEVTNLWNELTLRWNYLTWNEVAMERSDQIPVEYNSGDNGASNFKSTEHAARDRFEIPSPITPELYNTESYYQLIKSITNFEVSKSLRKGLV